MHGSQAPSRKSKPTVGVGGGHTKKGPTASHREDGRMERDMGLQPPAQTVGNRDGAGRAQLQGPGPAR